MRGNFFFPPGVFLGFFLNHQDRPVPPVTVATMGNNIHQIKKNLTMKISKYEHQMAFPLWTSFIKTDTVCYHLIMPQRLVFAVWNYKKKKVSLMYSLMMIILDYLQYWNVCFVKATGLTFFSQILFTLGKQFSTLAPTISFKCLEKHIIKLTLISVCSSISIYVPIRP